MSTASLPVVQDPPEHGPLATLRRLDWWLLGTTLALLAFGMIMILSASSNYADHRYGDSMHFVTRQGMGAAFGLTAMIGILFCPMRWIRRYGPWIYLFGLVGLVLVFTPLGHKAYGAVRWISLGPIKIQPSEFARIGLVLTLAGFLHRNQGRINDVVGVLFPVGLISSAMIVLLMLQPDFGTTVLTCALIFVMVFISGLNWVWVGSLGVTFVVAAGLGAIVAPYRLQRVTSFLNPFDDLEGAGHQVIQGWIAMASGGLTGQGIAGGIAQRGNLPEAHTDFIAAVVGEDLGAIGMILLVSAFGILVWRGYGIAARASSLYGALVAAALTTLLASQAVVNLGVLVGWAPPKGLVLPFLSYGASAVVAHLVCVGLLLRISTELPHSPSTERGTS
ncbi:MAG: putative lipid II flippase FtsW [Deltaproteobacteria bacterium]|nr:MAG: putative lipid II flippase FtsW [Deltaproteobacteria bacterium]